jgi:hypothetical protein
LELGLENYDATYRHRNEKKHYRRFKKKHKGRKMIDAFEIKSNSESPLDPHAVLSDQVSFTLQKPNPVISTLHIDFNFIEFPELKFIEIKRKEKSIRLPLSEFWKILEKSQV